MRTEDFRRVHRKKAIKKRMDSLGVPKAVKPSSKEVWQLYTPSGGALPIFKKREANHYFRREKFEIGTSFVVKLYHSYGCGLYDGHIYGGNYKQLYAGQPCTPQCGLKAHQDFGIGEWPVASEGFIWKLIAHTKPDEKEFKVGRYGKTAETHGKYKPTKNWKLLYTRDAKVVRARQLGCDWKKDSESFEEIEGESK